MNKHNPFVRINIPIISNSETWVPKVSSRRKYSYKNLRTIIPFILIMSMILNIYYLTRPKPLTLPQLIKNAYQNNPDAKKSDESTPIKINPVDYSKLTDLIIVPGHGLYKGSNSPLVEKNWDLTPVQKGNVEVYLSHIGKAIEVLQDQHSSLLLFSGGATRPSSISTESYGYWTAAEKLGWLTPEIAGRALTENFSTDSYENLLFSICRFNYIGIDPPGDISNSISGEKNNAYSHFEKDLYGCTKFLKKKKDSRNPTNLQHGYIKSCPELAGLLEYCPKDGKQLYEGKLPWTI
ncbi:hypothetical protein BB558_004114 [Smittium angustum]|uniref:DUF218 domain-containing protein n=1 Tax=Smittium angustum TaxID=133377 RepID=A0A2U1J467_SMIAN|nr:hypothetical protein BB558_004114 [Smittium angustum]